VRSELESHPEEKGSSAKSVLIPFLTYRSDCQWLGRLRRVGDRWFRTTNWGNGSHRNGGGERRREPVPGSSVCGGRRLCKPACEIVFRHRHGIASRAVRSYWILMRQTIPCTGRRKERSSTDILTGKPSSWRGPTCRRCPRAENGRKTISG
jgi:hypothetical protein